MDPHPASHAQFPEPIPHQQPVLRTASDASSMYHAMTTGQQSDHLPGYLDPPGTAFPVPQPYETVPTPAERRGVQLVDPGYVR